MARESARAKTKAAAIADLMDGVQPAIVAARYGLNAATVRSWKARLDLPVATGVATGVATVVRQPAIEAQQLALGEVIMANLRAKLIATQTIAEHVTTKAWLNEQTAADLAELFETIDRSAVNILDRMARGSRADDSAERLADDGGAAQPE